MMAEEWTEQDEAAYRPLRRKLLRIQAKQRRDKTRVRRFSPRSSTNRNKTSKVKVNE
jgi:hypothetical protein